MIYIDFETRSKCVIQKTGAWRYSEDPSTDVLCMAYAIDKGPVELWMPGEAFPFTTRNMLEHKIEAHHSFFERSIWTNVMVPKYGWPRVPHEQWECSASVAAYHALPRDLHQIGLALHLPIVKDVWGKRIMTKLSRPRKNYENDPAEMWSNASADFKQLYEYCKNDVAAERAFVSRLRPLPASEHAIWSLDQRINERGIRVDMPAVRKALEFIDVYQTRLGARFKVLTGIDSPTEVATFKKWLADQYCPVKSLDKNAVLTALAGKLEPNVREALQIRQALGKTSTAKYKAILESVCKDDRLRGLLMYFGAGTGRWSGQLVQPQNFPQNRLKGDLCKYFEFLKSADLDTFEMCYDVMQILSATIRGVFIPSQGHTFFGGDYSAIEARVLFWLASESRGLQMFRDGEDIYKDMATTIYGVELSKVTKDQRDLGKRGILGCGYGMGAEKFKDTCRVQARIEISDEMAQRVIQAYRTKYRTVSVMWQLQELAAKQAIQTKKPVRCGKVLWAVHDDFLFCRLPSGRCIAYYEPKIGPVTTSWGEEKMSITHMGMNSVTRRWERQSTYGGKIVENITQAVARDLMAEAMLRCEAHGYKVVLSVHDELLTERNTGDVKEFENLMTQLPAWAEGLPVRAEGWTGGRYLK